MAKTSYTSLHNVAMSLSHFAQSQTTDQRCARLRAMIIAAKRREDTTLLVTLKAQWQELKVEMMAEDAQNVAAALVEEASSSAVVNATNKAAHHLATGVQPVEVQPGVYLVPSGTRGGVVYRVTAQQCSCEAHGVCWHQQAVVILSRARGRALTA